LKKKGTKGQWRGKVVGFYSTDITPEGYAIESSREEGSVQIYPLGALELWPDISIEEQIAEETTALWAAGGDYCTARGEIWQLVPITPTNAMYKAAVPVGDKIDSCGGVRFKDMWEAILKVTPIPERSRNSTCPKCDGTGTYIFEPGADSRNSLEYCSCEKGVQLARRKAFATFHEEIEQSKASLPMEEVSQVYEAAMTLHDTLSDLQ